MEYGLGCSNTQLPARMESAVSLAWNSFIGKVGNGSLTINKEASMQLHFAYVLKQVIQLIEFHLDDVFTLELETGFMLQEGRREVDIVFRGQTSRETHVIAIEMKCYKTFASSGGKRGAQNIFMKDVYFDLFLLEQYIAQDFADEGIALVMTNYRNMVHPKNKNAVAWTYDTSDGATAGPSAYNTPVGGKEVNFKLHKSHSFHWTESGSFWFMKTIGQSI